MPRPAGRAGPERQSRRRLAITSAASELADRECLAQFLHDRIGGMLVQLRLAYGAWRQENLAVRAAPTSPVDGVISAAAVFDGLLGELCDTVRRLSFALAPPDWHDDLPTALESVATELRLRSGLEVRLDTAALVARGATPVAAAVHAVVCRVVRELGLNVQKHAGARNVSIEVRQVAGRLRVCVEDDGRGLASGIAGSMQGLGLRSARAQLADLGGDLTLRSMPGGGTCVTLSLPIHHTSPAPMQEARAVQHPSKETP